MRLVRLRVRYRYDNNICDIQIEFYSSACNSNADKDIPAETSMIMWMKYQPADSSVIRKNCGRVSETIVAAQRMLRKITATMAVGGDEHPEVPMYSSRELGQGGRR